MSPAQVELSRLVDAERYGQRIDDRPRDLVLNGEDVIETPVVLLRPEMEALGRVDQLRCDP